MDKAAEAFRTISEVAQDLDVPQHVLRFWETRFAQIKPMKRGGGRRYYRPGDVDLLKGIRHLLYDKGYTIRGVQRILREHGNPHVAAIGRGEVAALEEHQESGDTLPAHSSLADQSAPPAAAGPLTLSPQQVSDLELSLVDLAAARRLLASGQKAAPVPPGDE